MDVFTQTQRKRQESYIENWEEISGQFKSTDSDRDLKYVTAEVNRLKRSLGLNDTTGNLAIEVYKSARNKDLIHGQSLDKVIPACLYIACRQQEVGRSLNEISSLSIAHKKDIRSSAHNLSKELGIGINIVPPELYVDRFVKKMNGIRYNEDLEEFGDDVSERARQILEVAEAENLASGKSPTGFAAAAIYLAGNQLGYKGVKQQHAATVGQVNELTIRNRYQEQEQAWDSHHAAQA